MLDCLHRHRRFCIAILALTFVIDSATANMNGFCPDDGSDSAIDSLTVKVVTLNTSHGRRTAMNQLLVSRKRTYQNLDEIALLLRETGADIVALQEADAPSRWSGKFDHVQYLFENSVYGCFLHGYHAQGWLSTYGTALLSRVQLFEKESLSFEPSPPTKTKGFVRSTINWTIDGNTTQLIVVSVHLDFSRKKVRDSQIVEMMLALSDLASPIVIMGDLNSEWSHDHSPVKKLMDGLGLKAYAPENPDLGTYKSTAGKRLDWILISPQLEFISYKVLPDIVSDHGAVYAEIGYRE